MNHRLLDLLHRYKNRGLLVDTSLLLLYLVGSLEPGLIRDFKRTAGYSDGDFEHISLFIKSFEKKVITPHIVTQVSDFIDNRIELHQFLAAYISGAKETFKLSAELIKSDVFVKFGLADTGILAAAQGRYLILTDDGPLFGLLASLKIDAVNLDQIRAISEDI
jgi:hypothetical protein